MRRNTDRKICGTCEYWTGGRKPVFDAKGNPKVEIFDKTGLCENQQSKFIDQSRDNENSCQHHSKWTEIL